jgi:hydrogenase maturation protease
MKTLVIGYGNTLRGDDGVGFRLAEAAEAWHLDGVEAHPCHQLTPELAADIAAVDRVIFIDATLPQNPHSPIVVEAVTPEDSPSLCSAHHSTPHALLSLTQQLYGRYPQAYTMLLPSWSMGYSEDLSPIAQLGFKQGLRRLSEFISQPCSTLNH